MYQSPTLSRVFVPSHHRASPTRLRSLTPLVPILLLAGGFRPSPAAPALRIDTVTANDSTVLQGQSRLSVSIDPVAVVKWVDRTVLDTAWRV